MVHFYVPSHDSLAPTFYVVDWHNQQEMFCRKRWSRAAL